ncbi:MAG: helix-turn-helix transcriptional regulator, partial [Planctomycetes bacterium]|nr:helix-turn-helix transcriptional regulator [Planctomycetota bacterium]
MELPTGTRWFSSVATPLSGENGEVFAFQVISLDITRLKRDGNGSPHLPCNDKATENEIVDKFARLTAREREVFLLTAEGCTRTEIAKKLFISPRT